MTNQIIITTASVTGFPTPSRILGNNNTTLVTEESAFLSICSVGNENEFQGQHKSCDCLNHRRKV